MTDPTDLTPEEEKKTDAGSEAPPADAAPDPATAANDDTPARDDAKGSPFQQAVREIVEPFKGLAHTSRSLWGLYISYVLEGMVYFGILTIFGKYLSENVGLSDLHAGWVYSFFTGGITLAMLFLGGVADKVGVRKALLYALGLMIFGRLAFAVSGTFFPGGGGFGSMMFLFIGVGMLLVVIGYGMYQPAAYAGVKQLTNEKHAPMAFAMIYGLMNLGAFFSGVLSPIVRNSWGISSVYWVYAGATILAFLCVLMVMSSRAVARDTVTDISAKKPSPDGEGAQKPAEAPLFTPLFIGSAVVVVLALGFTIYLVFTSAPGPLDRPLGAYTKQLGKVPGMLAKPDPKDTKSKPVTEADFLKVADGIRALEAQIAVPTEVPEGASVDPKSYQLVRFIVKEEGAFIGGLWGARSNLWLKVPVNTDATSLVRERTRALGVAFMSAAYRLVGKFNTGVLTRIALQQKLPDEKTIPIPDDVRARIMSLTAAGHAEMFRQLALLTI